MSREGRSQPIQPRSGHGFADPGPAAVGTTPQRPTVIERERRRELALTPISINGLYAVSLVTVISPPSPVIVELVRRRELPPIPIAFNGLYAITLPTIPPPPPLVVELARRRELAPTPLATNGLYSLTLAPVTPPPPLVVEQASSRWRAIVTASSSGIQALVAAAFEATVLPPAPTQSVARESVRLPVPQPISQHGPVADVPVPPETPELAVGGRIFAKRPPIRTVTLRPRHATVRVTAFAPRLTITAEPAVGVVRTRTLAPAPTIVFGASAQSTETLGQLPRSKRDLINRLVMYDTATLGDGTLARSLVHEHVPVFQLATQSTGEPSRSKRDLLDKLVIYDTV